MSADNSLPGEGQRDIKLALPLKADIRQFRESALGSWPTVSTGTFLQVASKKAAVLNPPVKDIAIEGSYMVNEQNEQQIFHAVLGFRTSVPPDRPDLLLLELKTLDAGVIRLSMTKESAVLFGREIGGAAAK